MSAPGSFGNFKNQLETKRLLIVSDGALQYVSFAALPLLRMTELGVEGREVFITGMQLLSAAHEVLILPSTSTLEMLRREAQVSGK